MMKFVVAAALFATVLAGGPQVRCKNGKLGDGSACTCPQDACKSCILSDKATSCTACSSGNLLVGGACVKANVCHKKVIKGTDTACKCPKHCLTCHVHEGGASECIKCTNRRHLHGKMCVDKCPSHMSVHGHKKVGRMCTHPFFCFNGKVANAKGPVVPDKCACPDRNCQRCQFDAGASIGKCTRCKNKRYLSLAHTCVEDCGDDALPVGLGKYGRFCASESHSCVNGRETETYAKCKCVTAGCSSCKTTHDGEMCKKCSANKLLHNGKCLNECPKGTFVSNGRCLTPKD